jgi:MYXO-CTERM domain-containing protein
MVSMGAGFFAAALLWAHGARAQEECHTDADCGAARRCELPVSIDGCKEPPCDDVEPVTGDVGWCVPAALGKACKSDADCGDELECQTFGFGSCSSDQPECTSTSESQCQYPPPELLLCDSADHCAPPFACDTEQDEHACYYPDPSCETDADCGDDFECVDGASLAADDCPDCKPIPNQCSPKLIACDADSDCPSEWLCREIGYGYKASQWSDDVLGTKACVPSGTVQVSEGNFYLGGGFTTLAGGAGKGLDAQAAASGPAEDARDDSAGGSRDHSADEKPAADADGTSSSESSGCSVTAPGADAASGLVCPILGLVGLVLRRRRK